MMTYLEKFLALVERFVIAHEALAAGYAKGSRHTIITEDEVKTTSQTSAGTADAAATGRAGRGRSRAADAGSSEDTAGAGADAGADPAAGGGRRSRTRAPDNDTAGADAGAATGGRRSRTRAAGAGAPANEPKPDTPEQANVRADIESLCQLCGDVDDATADVKDYFNEKGWKTATDIPADELDAALNELNIIADKYFD